MEIDYNLPLELDCISVIEVPIQNGFTKQVCRYKAYIEWQNIVAIEEFIKHFIFPPDEQGAKCIILTVSGNHIIFNEVERIADMWARYKMWKSKQVIKPLFGAN